MSNKWISVKDQLPEEDTYVLGFNLRLGIIIASYQTWEHTKEKIVWFKDDTCYDSRIDSITHWIELPPIPRMSLEEQDIEQMKLINSMHGVNNELINSDYKVAQINIDKLDNEFGVYRFSPNGLDKIKIKVDSK